MQHEGRLLLSSLKTKADAVGTDGDRTAYKSNTAQYGIGLPYITLMIRTGHLVKAAYGAKGYFEVKSTVKADPTMEKDGAEGLKIFYSKLKRAGIGRAEEMEEMAYRYIRTHRIKSTWEIVTGFENRFLVTCNGSSVAAAANRIFHFTDRASNIDLFGTNGLIRGVEARIPDGEAKARALFDMMARHGTSLRKSVYIGDSVSDLPVLEMAGFPIASPFAIDAVKAKAHHILRDETLLKPIVML